MSVKCHAISTLVAKWLLYVKWIANFDVNRINKTEDCKLWRWKKLNDCKFWRLKDNQKKESREEEIIRFFFDFLFLFTIFLLQPFYNLFKRQQRTLFSLSSTTLFIVYMKRYRKDRVSCTCLVLRSNWQTKFYKFVSFGRQFLTDQDKFHKRE